MAHLLSLFVLLCVWQMLTMNRWFHIGAAERDLGYKPIVGYREGWADTLVWFKKFWLPSFGQKSGILGIAGQSQAKIDTQAEGVLGSK